MRFSDFLIVTFMRGGGTFCLTTLTVALAALSMKVDNELLSIITWCIITWNILLLTYKSATSIPFENKEEIKEVAKMLEEQEKKTEL